MLRGVWQALNCLSIPVAQFDCAVDRLHTKLLTLQMPDKLRTYVSNRIVNFLRDNVTAGCHGWTNNACESLNHILKLSVQWRPHKLPDLIEKLHKVVDAQYVEADRALLGYGDFVLRPEYISHISGSDPRRKKQHPHLSVSDRHLSLLS